MSSRGRHQTTSKECARLRRRIEALEGVRAVVIGRSYGGKSLGRGEATGSLRVQREMPAGVKAVTQTEKGVQEWMILTERAPETIAAVMAGLREIEAER